MQIIFIILLSLGIIGLVSAAVNFYALGTEIRSHSDAEDRLMIYYSPIYRGYVSRAADSLILILGAILFLWLLQ